MKKFGIIALILAILLYILNWAKNEFNVDPFADED